MPAQKQSGMVLQPGCLAKLDTTAAEAARLVGPYGAGEYDLCCAIRSLLLVLKASSAAIFVMIPLSAFDLTSAMCDIIVWLCTM